jgi:heme-degrading monooxygenase HmoA
MHIIISRYASAAEQAEAIRPKLRQDFVPLLQGCEGFLGYATFPSEQGDGVACLLWENLDAVQGNRPKIRKWLEENLQGFEEATERFSGAVGAHSLVAPKSGGADQSLYCLVRKSDGVPADGSQRRNVDEMLAAAEKLAGFRGMYFARSDDDPTRGAAVLFCETKEQAHAVHEATMAISRRNQPNIAVQVAASGTTTVLAMG